MSRIGNAPIPLPDGVQVDIRDGELFVKGSKGEMTTPIPEGISFSEKDGALTASRASDAGPVRALHGLARALAANAVQGVSEGFKRELEIKGIGYRAAMHGTTLTMQLGFSHPIDYDLPEGIDVQTPSQTEVVVQGMDKQLVGQVSAEIRAFRPPEPYKGKGVRYADERVRRKEAKKK